METIIERLIQGELLSGLDMQKIAETPPEAIERLLRGRNADALLMRLPTSIPADEGAGYLHLHLEVRLTPEGISRIDSISETLFNQAPVDSCFHMGGEHHLLILGAFRNVHEASTWVSLVQNQVLGIADTSSQFLHNSYQKQGYIQIRG